MKIIQCDACGGPIRQTHYKQSTDSVEFGFYVTEHGVGERQWGLYLGTPRGAHLCALCISAALREVGMHVEIPKQTTNKHPWVPPKPPEPLNEHPAPRPPWDYAQLEDTPRGNPK